MSPKSKAFLKLKYEDERKDPGIFHIANLLTALSGKYSGEWYGVACTETI